MIYDMMIEEDIIPEIAKKVHRYNAQRKEEGTNEKHIANDL